jgi:hypothetical protein
VKPETALKKLRAQPLDVRRAVECLLLSVDPQAVGYFGRRYTTQAVADELMGRPADLGPVDEAAVEIPLEE